MWPGGGGRLVSRCLLPGLVGPHTLVPGKAGASGAQGRCVSAWNLRRRTRVLGFPSSGSLS